MAKSRMPHRGEKSQVYRDMAGKNKTKQRLDTSNSVSSPWKFRQHFG